MKRRFPILAKVILLGIGVSILTSGTAIIVSYFNQKSRGEDSYIKNIDNTLDAVDEVFTSAESDYTTTYVDSLVSSKNYVIERYNLDPEKRGPYPNESFEDFSNYYKTLYPWLYPHQPGTGLMTKAEAEVKSAYYTILNLLNNFQMSSDSQSLFVAFKDSTIENRMIYIADSRMDDSNRQPNDYYQVPGYYYEIKQYDYIDDRDPSGHQGYVLNGFLTRFTNIYTLPSEEGGDKELIATIFVQYSLDKVHAEALNVLNKELLVLGLSSLVLIAIYTAFSYLLFVRNINKLTKASSDIKQRLIDKKMNKVIDIPVKSNDEMRVLANSFTEMEHAIINYVDIINKEAKEKERTNAELNVASKIQLDALPHCIFDDSQVSIRTYIKPAKVVGGDFYDYFYINQNELAVVMSDVSGKGIPASLFMMKSKELIKSKLLAGLSLKDAVKEVNDVLVDNNAESLFVTSFIGIINFDKKEIRFINAGHEKPYIISKDKVSKLDGNSNFVLGAIKEATFVEESCPLNVDDKLFLFTDGLNESINENKEEFSYSRIEKSLKNKNASLDEYISDMTNALNDFAKGLEPFDDVTMMIVNINDDTLHLSYDKKDLSIIEDIANKIEKNFDFVSLDKRSKVGIIIDELVNNLVSYEKEKNLKIDVTIKYINGDMSLTISSNGADYNPFEKHKHKYVEEYSDSLKEGGFGISLVKELSKKYSYKYENNHSVVELII